MEPDKDFVLIRDGPSANDRVLAKLTGSFSKDNLIVSTGNKLYVYTKTDQADSRKGFRIKYYEGKSLASRPPCVNFSIASQARLEKSLIW